MQLEESYPRNRKKNGDQLHFIKNNISSQKKLQNL